VSSWSFVDIGEYNFSSSDLQSIPTYDAGFIVASSLAVTDINVLLRNTILALNGRRFVGKTRRLKMINASDALVHDRALSAKIVEYCKLFRDYHKKLQRANSDASVVEYLLEAISKIDGADEFRVAKWLRDNLTNHVILNEIEKFLSGLHDKEVYSIFLSKMQGNTWHVLCDQVATMGKFGEFDDPSTMLNRWQDWILTSCKTTIHVHNQALIALIEKHFPTKIVHMHRTIVDDRLIQDLHQANSPLFWKLAE